MEPEIRIPEEVELCMDLLSKAGFESFIVGGAVRDALLHKFVHDYDLTTDALPEQMHAVFSSLPVIDTGIAHGTVTVVVNGMPIEITTYRTDTGYSDHRHPDAVVFTPNLREDCARRDLTINALAYHPGLGIRDFFNGREDLQQGIIRTVGSPERRFTEDALRILRAVRFMAQLDFTMDPDTHKAILKHKDELAYISQERITAELLRILTSPGCSEAFRTYRPLFEVFMPELKEIPDDAWEHVLAGLKICVPAAAARFAVILAAVPVLPENFFSRLKMSNTMRHDTKACLAAASLPCSDRISLRRIIRILDIPFETWLSFRRALEPELDTESVRKLYRQILEDGDCCKVSDLALSGKDLQAAGLHGSEIGEALNTLLDAVIEERCVNNRDALLAYISKNSTGDKK